MICTRIEGGGVVPSGFDLGDRSDFHYLHITPFAFGFSAVRPSSFRAVAPPICICLFLIFLSLCMYDTRIRSFHPFVLRASCMAAVLKSNPYFCLGLSESVGHFDTKWWKDSFIVFCPEVFVRIVCNRGYMNKHDPCESCSWSYQCQKNLIKTSHYSSTKVVSKPAT